MRNKDNKEKQIHLGHIIPSILGRSQDGEPESSGGAISRGQEVVHGTCEADGQQMCTRVWMMSCF